MKRKLEHGDEVLIRGKILSVDGNYATVGWDSTTISANVPLSKMLKVTDVQRSK